ncbi:MAG: ROK family protein [Patescibacteria group bacterium]|jgi:glucokinase
MRNNIYLGVDIGASKIRLGAIDSNGEVLSAKTIVINLTDPDKTLDLVKSESDILKKRFQLTACGIGAPGPLDYRKGIISGSPNMENWNGLNLIDIFKNITRIPCFIDRDSHNALRGERWLGHMRGAKNALMLTWGSGVGGAAMINSGIYSGISGNAGELGHIIIDPKGPECALGHKGCLESFIGGKAIEKKYGKSMIEICQEARDKKAETLKIIDEISIRLNQAIETYRQIFDPEIIVFGGSISRSLSLFIKESNLVKSSLLGADSGLFGSAYLAMENKR